MPTTIATWNINSVRLRIGLVTAFLDAERPDVLCLQETKSPVEKLPVEKLEASGYRVVTAAGFKGYNGVTILARGNASASDTLDFCSKGDARHVSATLPGGAVLHNFYVPSGGDEPDRNRNAKFAHKLDFVAEMTDWSKGLETPAILVGDLNIAPLEHDVWSHKQMLKVVSHTPVEVDAMTALQAAGDWVDIARLDTPEPEKLYSWWSYRSKDWALSNRGRRLDHIWCRGMTHVPGSTRFLSSWRSAEKPSDHVPVIATFDL